MSDANAIQPITPPLEVRAGQVWADEERGRITVLAVADGYAMLKRCRRNPFIVTVDQMLAGEYGWELLEETGNALEAVVREALDDVEKAIEVLIVLHQSSAEMCDGDGRGELAIVHREAITLLNYTRDLHRANIAGGDPSLRPTPRP